MVATCRDSECPNDYVWRGTGSNGTGGITDLIADNTNLTLQQIAQVIYDVRWNPMCTWEINVSDEEGAE